MFPSTIVSIILLSVSISQVKSGIFRCIQTENCSCSTLQTKYDFQCPSDNPEVIFYVKPYYELTFQYYNKNQWDLNLFPNLDIGDLEYFQMRMCPLPETFKSIADKFGVGKVRSLRFDYSNDFANNKSITKHLFEGLGDMEELKLGDNNIRFISEDAFDDLYNLKELDLRSNRIELHRTMFKNLKSLEWLDLSENELTQIPEGIFDNLTSLKSLHIWSNKLTHIDGELFKNLGNLKFLNLRFNKIQKLERSMWQYLKNLTEIDLLVNDISEISKDTFSENKKLQTILIQRNPKLREIPNGLFSNLAELIRVNMSENNLESVPNDLFSNSTNIEQICFSKNKLKNIPDNIFQHLKKLEELDLSYNEIFNVGGEMFCSLTSLKILQLEHNLLTNITDETLYYLQNLEDINLETNRIHTVHLQAFQKNEKLKIIRLSHNKLTFNDFSAVEASPFNFCIKLEELYLHDNFIDHFSDDWVRNKIYIRTIDVRNNFIKSISYQEIQKVSPNKLIIDVSFNNITEVDLNYIEVIARAQDPPLDVASYRTDGQTVLKVIGNPIECDCSAYDLIRYLEGSIDPAARSLLEIVVENTTCASPKDFVGIPLTTLNSKHLTCTLEQILGNYSVCPERCTCFARNWDKMLVYDCSYRNFTSVPEIYLPIRNFYNQVEVRLVGNQLKEAPKEGMGYENVSRLILSYNDIKEITWLPPKVEVLLIDHNNISFLDYNVLMHLNSSVVKNISLEYNPWKCNCDAVNLTNFLRESLFLKQYNPASIKCSDSGRSLITLNKKTLCPTHLTLILGCSLSLLALLFVAAVTVALYYRYQQEIKVWLFAHDMFLNFITEDEIDKGKSYDAFISYSHKDEEFVTEKLLPVLEDGPHPYKLCLHYRDWIPGEFISKQIAQSVENSRRTVVILSKNFLESVWGKMEFRTAHTQAISEGRARVIIILHGDIDPNDVDEELKAYLKTNTYLKWEDPWFWNKLRYALPHSKKAGEIKSQRSTNIMLTLNDKLDLITAPTTPNNGSTPPAVSLDPLLIKVNPLDFGKPEIRNTAPAVEA